MITPNTNRLVIIGLDCAEPSVVFDKLVDRLPNLSRLMKKGCFSPLRSIDPPLTIPAWTVMVSGKDPGTLGCYGIRNRMTYDYEPLRILNSRSISEKRIWDILSSHGRYSIVLGVPQTYPVSPICGCMTSCLLTPDISAPDTYPAELKSELSRISPDYRTDIDDYRRVSPDVLIGQIRRMTSARFRFFRYLLKTKPWDFAMMVEIGLDRLHHCYWHYWDGSHPLHKPGNGFEETLPQYYELLDAEIAETLENLRETDAVMIVSDHGAQPMIGGFRINEWLIREGYLSLSRPVNQPQPLEKASIHWGKTAAWGEGGYMGRIFLNVQGREPLGIIAPHDYEAFRMNLARKIEKIQGPDGESMGNRVLFPEKIYKKINGIAPDLMVYYGDLSWRALSEVGSPTLFTVHNDQGPDGANHAIHGVFISNRPAVNPQSLDCIRLIDIAPTALNMLNLEVPTDMQGDVIHFLKPV